ncbi:MAG: hypothetical protein R3F55_08610 [Alphaproteobacteria bacterium]
MKRLLGTTALSLLLAAPAFAQSDSAGFCADGWIAADTDNNGYVSADEHAAATAGVYSGYDADGDGMVSRDEYLGCVTAGGQAGEPGNDDEFMAADADGDGIVSVDEYRMSISTSYEQSGAADMPADQVAARAAAHFRLFDSNEDGKISREEWTGSPDETSNRGLGGRFDMMDTDQDGQVTRAEYDAASTTAYERAGQAARDEGVETENGVPVFPYHFWIN